jgi:hypothetical protein
MYQTIGEWEEILAIAERRRQRMDTFVIEAEGKTEVAKIARSLLKKKYGINVDEYSQTELITLENLIEAALWR